jgi:hypothetical protein
MALPALEHTMPPGRAHQAWPERVRVGLLVAWLVLLAAVWTLGEREVSLSDLDAAVSSGEVHTVGLSPGLRGSGETQQQAHWREGWRRYVVRVRVVIPDRKHGSGFASPRVVHENLGSRLRSLDPDVRAVRVTDRYPDASMLGRRVPQWVNFVRGVLGLGALGLLFGGPEPWRASRFAWFWLMTVFGLQTLGVLAFLALSGPTPLIGMPRPGARRLMGGWAFVIAVLLSGLGTSS